MTDLNLTKEAEDWVFNISRTFRKKYFAINNNIEMIINDDNFINKKPYIVVLYTRKQANLYINLYENGLINITPSKKSIMENYIYGIPICVYKTKKLKEVIIDILELENKL